MNMNQNQAPSERQTRARNAYWISLVLLAAFLSFASIYGYLALISRLSPFFSLLVVMGGTAVAAGISLRYSQQGRVDAGIGIAIAVVMVALPVSSLLQRGTGILFGAAQLLGISLIITIVLSRRLRPWAIAINLVSSILTAILDLAGNPDRVALPIARFFLPAIVILGVSAIAIIFLREFRHFRLRVKIVLGILVTGGVSLAVLASIAVINTLAITNSLSSRLETSVSLLAEEQLINTVFTEAYTANVSFQDITDEIVSLASYWSNLRSRGISLSEGSYWDARNSLFQLEAGHYGNSPEDVSSVYVPAKLTINDQLIGRLNESAYLDFYAPEILETNPSVLAVYGIDTQGATRYYPNINLASLLPPDFDPTQRGYYQITSPLFNPQKIARWSIPYVDAAGGGLVVTVASPVYFGDEFGGVVAADMRLATITVQVEKIRIGQTGYAFMLDDAGRIISMPDSGYRLFDIDPAEINPEEYFKQTVLTLGTDELQSITNRMVAGGSGLLVVNNNGVETYVAFAPIKANNYSVAVVVPVAELQNAIVVARNETRQQIESATRLAAILLAGMFLAAVAVSLGIGGVIAGPIVRLTEIANLIVDGDLTARAEVSSRDETGTLAQAFNTMTNRLRETLAGLEQRVEERTSELLAANRKIEQRALQFEGIAKVARTISSTRELDDLLPQIAAAIGSYLGYYHVGIFLLDPGREYAVLSASNSDGGAKMLANNHRLKVGETGIVGYVTGSGKPRVALDTGADSVFFDNPFLPDTRSEIALPLLTESEVIGALDVQSTIPNAFDQDDISILTTLADQVSIAIQNARQFEENKLALAESESLSRTFVKSGWQEFIRRRKLTGIRHSGARATLLYGKGDGGSADRSDSERDQTRSRARSAVLSLPITLRGEHIGHVEVRAPGSRQWSQDELEVVNAILDRAALALENARLLEDSQKRAAKERVIGEISAKISVQSDIDELLKIAALELSRTLPGAEVAVQFTRDRGAE
jgi:GAF domain-containing protein/HAMP domain-containing protein